MRVRESASIYVAYDLEGHSSVSGLFKCKTLYSAAIYNISTGTPASRGPSATAGLLVVILSVYHILLNDAKFSYICVI